MARAKYVLDSDRYLFTGYKKYPFITSLEEFMLDCDQSRCVYEYIIGVRGPVHRLRAFLVTFWS